MYVSKIRLRTVKQDHTHQRWGSRKIGQDHTHICFKDKGPVRLGKIIFMNALKVGSCTVGQDHTNKCFKGRVLYG